jgi:hypothetical protein
MNGRTVRFAVAVAFVSAFGFGALSAQDVETKAAQTATTAWLSLIDNQTYAASWTAAASFFRTRITQEQWEGALLGARAPLGQLKSRTLKSATPRKSLPGAPDGDYVVFEFTTAFEHKAAAFETVTAARDTDGAWRVAGYFIK